jgi:hypothetical protein
MTPPAVPAGAVTVNCTTAGVLAVALVELCAAIDEVARV